MQYVFARLSVIGALAKEPNFCQILNFMVLFRIEFRITILFSYIDHTKNPAISSRYNGV